MPSKTDLFSSPRSIRKRLLYEGANPAASRGEIDLASLAVLAYTSEDPNHRIENLIDGDCGPGGTFWASARTNTTERIILEFDQPQNISCMLYEVEERGCERTQEVRVEVSSDGSRSYRHVLVQEYTFSPAGATFQHEAQRLNLHEVTHLRLTIVPDKHGSGTARLTSLRLFS